MPGSRFFVFALIGVSDEWSTESRMFCPALGHPWIRSSGNAHAMLACLPMGISAHSEKTQPFNISAKPPNEPPGTGDREGSKSIRAAGGPH